MTIKYRSIPLCIVLSVITCGIYALYWFVCIADDANAVANKSDTSGGVPLGIVQGTDRNKTRKNVCCCRFIHNSRLGHHQKRPSGLRSI